MLELDALDRQAADVFEGCPSSQVDGCTVQRYGS